MAGLDDNQATDAAGQGGDAELPTPDERAASADSGGAANPLNNPAGGFDPGESGAAGSGGGISRDGDARKERIQGIVPLSAQGDAYAVLQLIPDGGAGGGGKTFEEFLLTSVSRSTEERFQIFETFRDPIIYFMDKAPEVYSFQGHVSTGVDAAGRIWSDDFSTFYEEELRGTKCVENNVRAAISYNSIIISGYLLNFKIQESSEQQIHATFSFEMFVTAVKYLGA